MLCKWTDLWDNEVPPVVSKELLTILYILMMTNSYMLVDEQQSSISEAKDPAEFRAMMNVSFSLRVQP